MVDIRRPIRQEVASRLVAIATSAGGLSALSQVLHDLPPGFPAAILIGQHLQPSRPSYLARILGWRIALTVTEAQTGIAPRNGTVYVATPGVHLLVGIDRRIALSDLPPLHYCRPSGDRLFTSLAAPSHPFPVRTTAIALDPKLAAGAQQVRRGGGIVIVQDVPSSQFAGMPRAAVRAGTVDRVLPLSEIGRALQVLVASGVAA